MKPQPQKLEVVCDGFRNGECFYTGQVCKDKYHNENCAEYDYIKQRRQRQSRVNSAYKYASMRRVI